MGYNNGGNRNNGTRYVGNPYNFASFPEAVIDLNKEPGTPERPGNVDHSKIDDSKFSGRISFSIKSVTPVFVGGYDGEHFYKNTDGKYAIPGSTIKGLVRENIQILSHGTPEDEIEDYRLMYRKVGTSAADPLSKPYRDILGIGTIQIDDEQVSACKNVAAGYIRNENGNYSIYQTKEMAYGGAESKVNYFPLRETVIIGDYLREKPNSHFKILFDPSNNVNKLENGLYNGEYPFDKNNRNRLIDRSSSNRRGYKPFMEEISYLKSGVRSITAVGKQGEYPEKGYAVSSGFMNDKKTLYIIPEIDEDATRAFDISKEDVRSYEIDYNVKEKLIGTTQTQDKAVLDAYKAFFKLPKNGETKPVFYIRYNGRLYFGFTPYLRLFYKHSTKEGVPKGLISTNDHVIFDFARTMLGYSDDYGKVKWKSRVFFENAVIKGDNSKAEQRGAVLGEPKPSSYLDYVRQKDSYEDDGFRLRGYKQYWLRDDLPNDDDGNQKDNVKSRFSTLPVGTVFSASVKFNSLTKEELGLLLWAIQLDDKCDLNIGKAKALGYGRIHISDLKLDIVDYAKMYEADEFSFEPYRQEKALDYISSYKKYVKENFALDVENDLSIHEFLLMKNTEKLPPESKIRYMHLGDRKNNIENEYQNRVKQLPTVDEVLETGKYSEEAKPHEHGARGDNSGVGNSQGGYKKGSSDNSGSRGKWEGGNFGNGRRGPIKPRDRRV